MVEKDFEPGLGRPRSLSARRSKTYLNRIVCAVHRTGPKRQYSARSSWSGSRNGRGFTSAGILGAGHASQPGRRRVIVKARITKGKGGKNSAAKSHLKYLKRDGVTRDGERGVLYNDKTEGVDEKPFLEAANGDRHQFRLIVAPEDSSQLSDLKSFTRDLMRQAERDLGTKLNWVAVDHFNTGHPHTHIVIRGKDDHGQDLVIARDYMSHGFRERARNIVTLELGPETQLEMEQKLQREMTADRLTRIDRALLRETENGILAVNRSSSGNQQWLSLKTGRLRKLQTMGLADEVKPGVWQIAERTESVLRELGQRNDIIKTMQRVLKDTGLERGATEFNIFKAEDPTAKVVGRVLSLGLSDESSSRHYVVVDGIDGKLHYATIGHLNTLDPPERNLLVTLKGRQQPQRRISMLDQQAQIFVESHAPLERLISVNGATWLDRTLLSGTPKDLAARGFGAEVLKVLRQRQQWLVREGLMQEQNGRLIALRHILRDLTKKDIAQTGSALEKKLGLQLRVAHKRNLPENRVLQFVRLASGRFALMQQGNEFALVPWRQAMQMQKSRRIGIKIGA